MQRVDVLPRFLVRKYGLFRGFLLDQRFLPRWAVLSIDLCICFFSYFITELILKDTALQANDLLTFSQRAIIIVSIHLFCFVIFRSYSGIIRHSTFTDVYRLALATASVFLISTIGGFAYRTFLGEKVVSSTSLLLYAFLSLTFLIAFRIVVKESYRFMRKTAANNSKKRILVFGVDDKSVGLAQSLMGDSSSPYRPVGFLSMSNKKLSFKIMDLPVVNCCDEIEQDLKRIKELLDIDGILLVGDNLSVSEKNRIVEKSFASQLEVYNTTLPEKWEKLSDIGVKITPIQIEDLLERNVIETDVKLISEDLCGKTVLVTGGAGSIGSELVRQIAELKPRRLIALDNAESPLHEIDLYLQKNFPGLNCQVYLADVTNRDRMEGIFSKYKFDVVYHAAAYKHVPMIEKHPREGVRANIIGTRILAELAVQYKSERFVMISTDKAVNPSNVMGASKRAAEMYVQALQHQPGVTTKFMTTRFGNVLGSNGSVIPFFKEQIKRGGPVTVTHKDITRYFMTIREACQLVLQAGTMGRGGEIFVFDMGKPVRILDMAERMIKLSGLQPYVDISIEIVGLREGEKLYEELLIDGETTLPTFHPKIMVGKVVDHDYNEICAILDELELMTNSVGRKKFIIQKLKCLIPEYVSQNSVFSELDEQH
ncbi:NDP-sugar epimerase, includes UDP-GlcNAc-inverting 4,6-dehydratase FlaA1 and capsular polysaccharide biosynthesis protein EpsC [Aequorivita viscosa]|uniref:NDP-sugar epimerase, includes UDP-GlcNAc-inverting 4,6-dehydratase FlaA1 and capsular polysaccharide biosynthesis protein EpsC n=1 Tax=Aequorivita viscosa TaxID=797419 RepID=A0A1M6K8G0_9FLAO|nr:NDP-sugar epimerase, includes UDP-GlcNAc-inverting 4,6-dehydratase FlaA1 and capsular polysaccharide biosynthesis protein EpsC [Aequorivita viscosa]SHJ55268.1 NDP-sugar epimerase, includes UDP-GlcNAc-inverting 4,6-dehydratase FlaA1 and capsular polysaccharide biosynthesis protein EpsC [Aequorivita viscosa]